MSLFSRSFASLTCVSGLFCLTACSSSDHSHAQTTSLTTTTSAYLPQDLRQAQAQDYFFSSSTAETESSPVFGPSPYITLTKENGISYIQSASLSKRPLDTYIAQNKKILETYQIDPHADYVLRLSRSPNFLLSYKGRDGDYRPEVLQRTSQTTPQSSEILYVKGWEIMHLFADPDHFSDYGIESFYYVPDGTAQAQDLVLSMELDR